MSLSYRQSRLTQHSELRGRDRESGLQRGGRQFTGGPGRVSVCQAMGDNGTQRNFNKQALLDSSLSIPPSTYYHFL